VRRSFYRVGPAVAPWIREKNMRLTWEKVMKLKNDTQTIHIEDSTLTLIIIGVFAALVMGGSFYFTVRAGL
jgi:hypothetical protein